MLIRIQDPKNVHMDPDPGQEAFLYADPCGSGYETLDKSIGIILQQVCELLDDVYVFFLVLMIWICILNADQDPGEIEMRIHADPTPPHFPEPEMRQKSRST